MGRVELNHDGIRELLQSQEVQDDLERRARAIAAQAGEGMEVDVGVGPNRARAAVVTGTIDAMVAEATDRTLTAALDAGRDG